MWKSTKRIPTFPQSRNKFLIEGLDNRSRFIEGAKAQSSRRTAATRAQPTRASRGLEVTRPDRYKQPWIVSLLVSADRVTSVRRPHDREAGVG
jgi:hypothetical protein